MLVPLYVEVCPPSIHNFPRKHLGQERTMPQQLPPAVRRFQAIKAERKRKKIAEVNAIAKIKEANPSLTDKQALQIYEASQALKERERRVQIKGKHGKAHTVKVVTK